MNRLLKNKNAVLALTLIFFLFGIGSDLRASKKYTFTRLHIEAQLASDGSMRVNEHRTYDFTGSFSYAFRTFPKDGRINFSDFQISENGWIYQRSDSEEPGTFKIIEKRGVMELRWFHRTEDESRTFTVSYKAGGAVIRHPDAAVLHYEFISGAWEDAHHDITLNIRPPENIVSSDVLVWIRSPLDADYSIDSYGNIHASCGRVRAGSVLRMRAVYPPEFFPDADYENTPVRSVIIEKETQYADEALARQLENERREALRRERWQTGQYIVLLAGLLGFFALHKLYKKYGKRYKPQTSYYAPGAVPKRIKPALLSYLLYSKQITGSALASTLFDLARQGILKLKEVKKEGKSFLGSSSEKTDYIWELNENLWIERKQEMPDYENQLLSFLFTEISENKPYLPVSQMKKKQNKMTRFFPKWQKMVRNEGKKQGWYDEKSMKGMWLGLGLAFLFMLAALPGIMFWGIAGISGFLTGFIIMMFSFFIPRKTEKGQSASNQWKALKKFLMHKPEFIQNDHFFSQINDYFVYGVLFGITKKRVEHLIGHIPQEQIAAVIPWYVLYSGGAFNASAFAGSFSAMTAATTSSVSTAAGASAGAGAASSGGGGAG